MFPTVAFARWIWGIGLLECLPLTSPVDFTRMTLGIRLLEPPPVLSAVVARSYQYGAGGRTYEESQGQGQ